MRQPLDHLRSRKKPVTRKVWISLDSDTADDLYAALDRLADLKDRRDKSPRDADLQARVSEAEEEVERLRVIARENSAAFVARSLGRTEFEELQNAYPATEIQQKKAKKDGIGALGFNPDTFPPALILASVQYVCDTDTDEDGKTHDVLEPLTEEFVAEIWDGTEEGADSVWNSAEVMGLFTAAYEVNQSRRVLDLGNGSRQMLG